MSMVVVDDECWFHAWDNGPLGAMDPLVDASWTISFLSSGLLLPYLPIFSLGVMVGLFGVVLMLRSFFKRLGGGREAVVEVMCATS